MLHNGGAGIDNFIGTPNAYANAYHLALAANKLPGAPCPRGTARCRTRMMRPIMMAARLNATIWAA
ncbi:hypothetical protein RAA17_21765 [Komagataeibacter rhaeticus]|nr:hypothetical protein [Komagataeibacter rhaeticus]